MTGRGYLFLVILVNTWALVGIVATYNVHLDTKETLRLLKRGDKVDCRLLDMKGTMP